MICLPQHGRIAWTDETWRSEGPWRAQEASGGRESFGIRSLGVGVRQRSGKEVRSEKRPEEGSEGKSGVAVEKVWRFKELLLELSARLISIHPEEIGREIEGALRLAGEFWGFDRIILAELSRGWKRVQEYSLLRSARTERTSADQFR